MVLKAVAAVCLEGVGVRAVSRTGDRMVKSIGVAELSLGGQKRVEGCVGRCGSICSIALIELKVAVADR